MSNAEIANRTDAEIARIDATSRTRALTDAESTRLEALIRSRNARDYRARRAELARRRALRLAA